VLQRLQDLACLHIADFRESVIARDHEDLIIEDELNDIELEKKINDLGFAIRCLSPFEKRTGLLNMIAGKKVLLSKDEYKDILESFDESDIVKKVRDLEIEEQALLTEITNNEAVIRELTPWRGLDINIEEVRDTDSVYIRLGKIPINKLSQLREALDKTTDLYELHEVNTSGQSAYILISYIKDFEDAIEDALTINSFERKDFKKLNGKISGIIKAHEEKDEKDDERLVQIGKELFNYAQSLSKIKIIYDHMFNEYGKKRVEESFGRTDNVILIEGFVDVEELSNLKETIEGEFRFSEIKEVEISKDEKVPTKLNNKSITKSFEIVLDLYGMPSFKSFDPTVFLMPFFAVIFGFCLTDGGYGILLVALSLLLVKKFKPIFGSSKLMWVLMVCGFTTIGVGVITGGWFGDIIDYLPESFSGVKAAKNSMVIFDPMKESMLFFKLSLAMGYIHLLFGLMMSFVKYVKDGRLVDGLCEKMTWVVFLISVMLWILAANGILPQAIGGPSKFVFIAVCIVIIGFSDRKIPSKPVRFASGFYNLYGSTSYVGDILSYLRILALGLASGVIAVVINVICKLAWDIPYVGFIVAAIIFVGGHIFNLVISSLGAFVHTLRLNYAEFFPKFFQSGGLLFSPFKMEPSYTIFNDESDSQVEQ
jgi:V/A-type H+-transporting ATPase subunit I